MSSQTSREEERRFNIRTLLIASAASATAAIVTSRLWAAGTPIAAAMTPVIVTLVSELLHRPSERIAERLTAEGSALRAPTPRAPAPREGARPEVVPDEPEGREQARVQRQPPGREVPWRATLVTAAAAFLIGAAILTLPELIAGQSIGKSDRGTTIFGGSGSSGGRTEPQDQRAPVAPPNTQTVPARPQAPARTRTQPQAPAQPTTPDGQNTQTTPAPTTTQPAPKASP